MQIKILDTSFDLDILDADVVEKIEISLENVKKEVAGLSDKLEEMKTSQCIRETCHIVFSCVNSIFGEGSDKKIFGDKCNLIEATKAMAQLSEFIVLQTKEANNFLEKSINLENNFVKLSS